MKCGEKQFFLSKGRILKIYDAKRQLQNQMKMDWKNHVVVQEGELLRESYLKKTDQSKGKLLLFLLVALNWTLAAISGGQGAVDGWHVSFLAVQTTDMATCLRHLWGFYCACWETFMKGFVVDEVKDHHGLC